MPKAKSGMKKGARKGTRRTNSVRTVVVAPRRRTATGVREGKSSPIKTSALPAIMGLTAPRSLFGFGGAAQAIADYDPDASLRVRGRDLFYLPIKSGSSTPAAGFGGTATYYALVTPREISNRLENIEEIFQYYAIRKMRVYYAPATGSTSTVQIALGYLANYGITYDITAPTQSQVLEMSPAALFPAWQPAMIEVLHRGTKLFSCDDNAAYISNDAYQGVLACTILNGSASVTYGQLWIEFVTDFYQPCPILGDVSVAEKAGQPTVARIARHELKRVGTSILRGAMIPCRTDAPKLEIKTPPRPLVPDSRPPFTPGAPPPTDSDSHLPFYPGFRGGRWVVDPIDDSVVVSASSTPTTSSGPVKVPSTKK